MRLLLERDRMETLCEHLMGGPLNGNVGFLNDEIYRACGCYSDDGSPATDLNEAIRCANNILPGWNWRVASCSVSDDAWITPDFNDPEHGEDFKQRFPIEAQQDPVAFFGTDVDRRPPGNPAAALCASIMLALLKLEELEKAEAAQ